MQTPVAFLVFNRPGVTERVFQAIRNARPSTLLVVADGPRPDRAGEAERCAAVRAIVDHVDWPCEVVRNYADVNLGCRKRVSSGIDWVFEQVEEAIILEDDCLPCPDFFPYCAELLDRYRHDERIMHISGSNLQLGRRRTSDSYYFSKYPLIWGWATWRRAWRHYDVDLASWPAVRQSEAFPGIFSGDLERDYYVRDFAAYHGGGPDTWDVQWTYACWCQGGLSITPEVNLISNIGFGADATHTTGDASPVANLATGTVVPLRHPRQVMRHAAADDYFFHEHVGGRQLREMRKLRHRARMGLGAWRRHVSRGFLQMIGRGQRDGP